MDSTQKSDELPVPKKLFHDLEDHFSVKPTKRGGAGGGAGGAAGATGPGGSGAASGTAAAGVATPPKPKKVSWLAV